MQRILLLLIAMSFISACSTFRPATSPERNAKLRRSFDLGSKISPSPCQQYVFKVQDQDVLVSIFRNSRNISYSVGELEVNINEDQGILTEHMRSIRPATIQFTDRVLDTLIRKQESSLAEIDRRTVQELASQ
jgi:hypothetical protein